MSQRVSLPADLGNAVLSRSGEGVTFTDRTASVPASTEAARTLNPSRVSSTVSQSPQPKTTQQVAGRGWGFSPYTLIWLVVIPIVVWIILFTLKPNMITDLVDGKRRINTSKLLLWTIIITAVIIGLLFLAYTFWPSA